MNKILYNKNIYFFYFKKQYYSIYRLDNNYKLVCKTDLNFFQSLIGNKNVIYSENFYNSKTNNVYNINNLKDNKLYYKTVLFPESYPQIIEILKYCNENKIAINTKSINKNLFDYYCLNYDEIVINICKFNKIISVNELSSIIHLQSGVLIKTLNEYLLNKCYMTLINDSLRRHNLIGEVLSKNHAISPKYNEIKKHIKGIKAILPNGDIIDNLNALPKNNTGYDLKQLFIGSKGCAGIITECLIDIVKIPLYSKLYMISANSLYKLLDLHKELFDKFNSQLFNSIYYFDTEAMFFQKKIINNKELEYLGTKKHFVIIDIKSNSENEIDEINNFFCNLCNNNNKSEYSYLTDSNLNNKNFILYCRDNLDNINNIALSYTICNVQISTNDYEYIIELLSDICMEYSLDIISYGDLNLNTIILKIIDKKINSLKQETNKNKLYLNNINNIFKNKYQVIKYNNLGIIDFYINRLVNQINNTLCITKEIKHTLDPNNILNRNKFLI